MFDGYWRDAVERCVDPLGRAVSRTGVSANVLTTLGVVTAVAVAVTVGAGQLRMGLVLLAVAGVADLLDGPVANAAGPTSKRGAFFDSTADRVTDTLLFGGVAWHLISEKRGHLVMVPVAVMAASWLISYQRAKAESLDLSAKGGIMERAERIIALGFGLALPSLLIAVLWVMLVLTLVTALQRFVTVWRQATVLLAFQSPR